MRDSLYFGVTTTSILLKLFVATPPPPYFLPFLLTCYHQVEKTCLQENEANIYNVADMRDEKDADYLTRVNRLSVHVCFVIMSTKIYNFKKGATIWVICLLQ